MNKCDCENHKRVISEYSNIECIKSKNNPVLDFYRNSFGSVWRDGQKDYFYWCDFKNVYLSTKYANESVWSKGTPILLGGYMWDREISLSMVFKDKGSWWMLYRGRGCDNYRSYAIGLASSEDGLHWEKYEYNPVMKEVVDEWDGMQNREHRMFDPWGIIKVDGVYHLWFNSENPDRCRSVGLAYSKDLVNWKRDTNNPIFDYGRFCVFPFKWNSWYWLIVPSGGLSRKGDVRFELYRCKSPSFYRDEREFVSNILNCGNDGQFDSMYIDTPCLLTKDIERDSFFNDTPELYYTGEGPGATFWRHGMANLNLESLPS